jgi:hypothetical protein
MWCETILADLAPLNCANAGCAVLGLNQRPHRNRTRSVWHRIGSVAEPSRCHEGVTTHAPHPRIPADVDGRNVLVDKRNEHTREHGRPRSHGLKIRTVWVRVPVGAHYPLRSKRYPEAYAGRSSYRLQGDGAQREAALPARGRTGKAFGCANCARSRISSPQNQYPPCVMANALSRSWERSLRCGARVGTSARCGVQYRLQHRFGTLLFKAGAVVLESGDEVGVLGRPARQQRLDPQGLARIARYQ